MSCFRNAFARAFAAVSLALLPAVASAQDVPAIVSRARIDPNAGVNFHAVVLRDTVYVGEQVTYQVGVFLDEDTRMRLRRSPEFVPAEPQGMLGYDVAATRSVPVRVVDGRRFEAHVFQRALFPLTSGRLEIPPAQLIYSLPLSSSFFSREESHTVRTESLAVIAVEPPVDGRPADFDGAVGSVVAFASLDSSTPRVGDPVTLTVRVSGTGNIKLFPRPRLDVPWASAVPSGERVRVDTTSPVITGEKSFQWILTPREAGAHQIGAIRYPYFRPDTRRYEVALTDPVQVDVGAGSLVAVAPDRPTVEAPSIRRQWRGPLPDPTPLSTPFWLVAALAPGPALGLRALRRTRRPRAPRPAARLRTVARRAARDGQVRTLRGAFADALAWRVGAHPLALAAPGAASRALRRAGVTGATADRAEALLAELSHESFAASGGRASVADAARQTTALYRLVDREAIERPPMAPFDPRERRATPRAVRPLALVLVASLGAFAARDLAAGPEAAAASFAEGVKAYDARDFDGAAHSFAAAGAAEPRAADAWANAGTAAWAAGDTASAVVGWQRALRLETSADDVRDRLLAFAPNPESAEASVPRIPPTATALVALLLWCAAWFAALARTRRRARWGRATVVLAVTSVLVGGAALWAWRAIGARDLRVVAGRVPVRVAAALGADAVGTTLVGEVARVEDVRGAWSLVRIGADREGWVETPALLPLALPARARLLDPALR